MLDITATFFIKIMISPEISCEGFRDFPDKMRFVYTKCVSCQKCSFLEISNLISLRSFDIRFDINRKLRRSSFRQIEKKKG